MWRLFFWGIPLLLVIVPMVVPMGTIQAHMRALGGDAVSQMVDALAGGGPVALVGGGLAPAAAAQGETALDHVRLTGDRWEGDETVLASEAGLPVFQAQVFARPHETTLADVPGNIHRFAPLSDCAALVPAAPGERVVLVRGEASPFAGLMTANAPALRAAVEKHLADLRSPRGPAQTPALNTLKGLSYRAFELAVTEAGQPLHLVLEGDAGQPRLWNLHLAPSARLARVTLLGGDKDGLAHLPAGVPVQLAPRAVLAACGAEPAYPLAPSSHVHYNFASGDISAEKYQAKVAAAEARYRPWADWFAARFGAEPLEIMVGFDIGAGVLIGPLPARAEPVPPLPSGAAELDARLAFAPLAGAQVALPEGVQVLPAGRDAAAVFQARIEAKAREIAGPAYDRLAQHPRLRPLGGL